MGINVFTFSGNLGRDAEQRFTAGGDSVVQFSVPVTSGFGDKEITSWVRCAMFGDRGTKVLPYLKKGQFVCVSGEFAARPWTNKEGQEQLSIEVRVNSLNLMGSKPQGKSQNDSGDYSPAPTKNKPKPSFDEFQDIPF